MQQTTISKPLHQYVKLVFSPHDPAAPPVDRATLHILLTRAMTEMYGRVGAGAISALGDGVDVLDISASFDNEEAAGDNASARQVLLRVASSSTTQLLATLPFSSASEQYSIEVVGASPSLPLAKAARPAAVKAGSLAWIQAFEQV